MPIPAALAVGGALTAAKVAARALLKKRAAIKATGGSKKSPNLEENVIKGVKEDIGRIRKARTSTAKGAAREAVQAGASRAKERLVKRGAAVGAAVATGAADFSKSIKSISSSSSSSSRSRTPNVDSTGRSTVIKLSPPRTSPTPTPKSRGSKKSPTPAETPTRKKFSNAFGAARKAGKKGFTFEGKRFNTKLRGE